MKSISCPTCRSKAQGWLTDAMTSKEMTALSCLLEWSLLVCALNLSIFRSKDLNQTKPESQSLSISTPSLWLDRLTLLLKLMEMLTSRMGTSSSRSKMVSTMLLPPFNYLVEIEFHSYSPSKNLSLRVKVTPSSLASNSEANSKYQVTEPDCSSILKEEEPQLDTIWP